MNMICRKMGSATSSNSRAAEIEQALKKEERERRKTLKMLLIGPGESGKSTVLKQMRLMHNQTFNQAELDGFRGAIYSNMIETMHKLLKVMERDGNEFTDPVMNDCVQVVYESVKFGEQLPPQKVLLALATLWKNSIILALFKDQKTPLNLPDNVSYFYDEIKRLIASDYQPSEQDLLYTRIQTTGENTYEQCVEFIRELYLARAKNKDHIFTHEVCATDKNQVQNVIDSVIHSVIGQYLAGAGLV